MDNRRIKSKDGSLVYLLPIFNILLSNINIDLYSDYEIFQFRKINNVENLCLTIILFITIISY